MASRLRVGSRCCYQTSIFGPWNHAPRGGLKPKDDPGYLPVFDSNDASERNGFYDDQTDRVDMTNTEFHKYEKHLHSRLLLQKDPLFFIAMPLSEGSQSQVGQKSGDYSLS